MNIIKLTINNYKSLGNERNVLYLDPVTAIIGKNESGKSNILDAVGNLPFLGKSNKEYYNNKNRAAKMRDEISVIIGVQFNENEIEQYNVKTKNSELIFTNGPTIALSGGWSELIRNDSNLMVNIDNIVKTKGDRNLWNIGSNETNRKRNSYILDNLMEASSVILLNFQQDITTLKQQLNRNHDRYKELIGTINEISSILSKYYSLLPRIFYREQDSQLEYSYNYERIKEILKNKNDIFYRLMLAAGIDEEEITRAFEEKVEGDKQNIRDEIEEKIKLIGEKFNDFYTQENVKLKPRFEGNIIKFRVVTNNGKTMLITERSNGLRWYFSLFIDILSNDFNDSHVVFLFDEPGVHLHVNAQKELLKLFDHLTQKGHRVIYTTHSPSMIDGDNIVNVRAIEKNNTGNTIIYNNCYDQRLSSESKMETLSPLLKAIGADLRFNLGPQISKINIITEGITDYMYLKAMLHFLNVEDTPNIIPSAGVENINKIVSILMGWGCEYKILLDFDIAGRKEYNFLVEKLDPSLVEHIVFVNGEEKPSLENMKSTPVTIEDLISELDFNKLSIKLNSKKENKVLVAKEFHDKIVSGQIIPEQKTVEGFEKILDKLNIPYKGSIALNV